MNVIEHTMHAVASVLTPIINTLFRRPPLSDKALEALRKRAEAHAAACADLDNDPLIRACFPQFYPAEPIKPMGTPTRPGAMLRRQAD